MNTKLITMSAAAALCMGVFAADEAAPAEEKGEGWAWAMGEGVTFDETPIVSTELSLSFDSKYLSYGFVDNVDPILTPAGSMTFFDWITFGVSAIFDTTKYGYRAGYTSRQFQYTELHPTVTIGHSFSPEDFEWLPTTVEFAFGWDYEYHPNSKNKGGFDDYGFWDKSIAADTHFWTFEFGLPDLWFEPKFFYERDAMRDNGTYMNLEIGHTFAVIGDEEEETLTLRPSVAQGFGTRQRVRAYASRYCIGYDDDEGAYFEDEAPLDHAGLMDTMFKLEAEWSICDGVALSGYVGYSDFLFDRKIRHASRRYECSDPKRWEHSWNVVAGLALTLSF